MSEIIEKPMLKRKILRDIFSKEEIFSLIFLVLVNLIVIFYFLGRSIINFNNYFQYFSYTPYEGEWFVLQSIFLNILFSSFLSILITVNIYFLIELISLKLLKPSKPVNLTQIIQRFIITNIVFLCFFYFVYILSSISYGYFAYPGSGMSVYTPLSTFNSIPYFATFSIVLCLLLVIFFVYRYFKKDRSTKGVERKFSSILKINFLIFYVINILITIYLYYLSQNMIPIDLDSLLVLEVGINLSIIFLKPIFERRFLQYSPKSIIKSASINLIGFIVLANQYWAVYGNKMYYYQTDGTKPYYQTIDNILFLYVLILIGIIIFASRKQIKYYSMLFIRKISKYASIIMGTMEQ